MKKTLCSTFSLVVVLCATLQASTARDLLGVRSAQEPHPGERVRLVTEHRDPFSALFSPVGPLVGSRRPAVRLAVDPVEETNPRRPALFPAVVQQQQARPPAKKHTGIAALMYETASDFGTFPRRRSTWVILGIGLGTAALAHPADDYVNGHIGGSTSAGRFFAAGKWIGYTWVQAGAAVGLYAFGRYVLPHTDNEPKTNKVSHLGFDMLRAIIVSQALTQGIKHVVRRERPTGDCCSFPSGHAATTFAVASVLERHLGYRAAWPTLVIATYVGASRLHDNRHFFSDVLFGSALGIASGWTVVGRHGRSDYALIPAPTRGGVMITLARRPGFYSQP